MKKGLIKMSKVYLTLADGFEKLAEGYRALAKVEGQEKAGQAVEEMIREKPPITIEMIRALLANKSRDGKTKDIKALLMKYDAGKLSGVKPEDYENLMSDAEKL